MGNWIMNNYMMILVAAVLIIAVAGWVYWWIKLPSLDKKEKVKAWLEWAVTKAEKELGKETGQAKLRYVWDLFSQSKFGWISRIIKYEYFASWVDHALVWLNNQLQTNDNLYKYVYGMTREEYECSKKWKEVIHD